MSSSDHDLNLGRYEEKQELQQLNERVAAYIQAIRSKKDKATDENLFTVTNESLSQKLQTQKDFYEKEIFDLQNQLETLKIEKNQLGFFQIKYDTLNNEFEKRISDLNKKMKDQKEEFMKLQVEVSSKDMEIEKLKSQIIVPQSQLETCKLESEDLMKKLEQLEEKCSLLEKEKQMMEEHFIGFETRYSFDVQMYQQEISNLQDNLDKSRQLVLDLEGSLYDGKHNENMNEIIKQTREKSDLQIRRFIDESESKHQLDVSRLLRCNYSKKSTCIFYRFHKYNFKYKQINKS